MSIEAMKLALEALDGLSEPYDVLKAQDALRQAIEQAEQAQESPKFDPNNSFARDEAARARVREFMRNH